MHGIGGAKYDELGDELAREFFQDIPRASHVVSVPKSEINLGGSCDKFRGFPIRVF